MIFISISLTTLFIVLFYMANQSFEFATSPKKIFSELKLFPFKLNNVPYIYLALAFICFMLLPIFWGLSFYLNSDANVVVTVFGLAWIYNWVRILYFPKKKEN